MRPLQAALALLLALCARAVEHGSSVDAYGASAMAGNVTAIDPSGYLIGCLCGGRVSQMHAIN